MKAHLCFHGIGVCERERERGESRFWTSESMFLRVLDMITRDGSISVSFDDGNRSDIEVALPALLERGLSATFFVVAGRLDDPQSLSPADLRELRGHGMGIGSHGWDHVPWRRLSTSDVAREIVDSRTVLAEASGGEVSSAACPLGQYDRASLRALQRAGYDSVFTSDHYTAADTAWLRPRYSVTAQDSVEAVTRRLPRLRGPGGRWNSAKSVLKRLR